jgi:hypothetical protein
MNTTTLLEENLEFEFRLHDEVDPRYMKVGLIEAFGEASQAQFGRHNQNYLKNCGISLTPKNSRRKR